MRDLAVCSFWAHRPSDFPDAPDYLTLLRSLDHSCRRLDFDHVVLTDRQTAPRIAGANMLAYATELPRNLMKALTESQARWLDGEPKSYDTLFVGADCLVYREFRDYLPPADLSIILRPGHKRHQINNGFMFVPATSREKVAPLFRQIADSTGEVMCDDMVAVERALSPMPGDYCLTERAGITVNFLPMDIWNAGPRSVEDAAENAHVLHFRGKARKTVMVPWAERWLT